MASLYLHLLEPTHDVGNSCINKLGTSTINDNLVLYNNAKCKGLKIDKQMSM